MHCHKLSSVFPYRNSSTASPVYSVYMTPVVCLRSRGVSGKAWFLADVGDVAFQTGVICAVQRRREDRVQAERLSRQRRRHVFTLSHPLPRRKHQDRFDHAPHATVTKAVSQPAAFLTTVSLRWAGVALKHTYDKAFSVENGMRRNVPRVVVAITDGRSQDEVKKNAAKLQHAGGCPEYTTAS